MNTHKLIEGLQILQKYRDNNHGFDIGAEHDVIYAYETDRPVEAEDLERLIALGWFQEGQYSVYQNDESTNGAFAAKHYCKEESWTAYV